MNPEKLFKYLIPLFVLAIVSRAIEEISFFYYAVPVMCVVFIIYFIWIAVSHSGEVEQRETSPESVVEKGSDSLFASLRRMTSLILVLIPGVWFLLTALWSSYPMISAERALYFILISMGCISAGILWTKYSGNELLDFLLPANVLVVLLCIFSLITNIPSDSWMGGNHKGFMGFFGQQNLLASVLLFTMPVVFVKLKRQVSSEQLIVNSNETKSQITTRLGRGSTLAAHYLLLTSYSLLLASNLIFLLLTYSRASILSLVIGAVVFLVINKNWKVIAYSLGVIIIFVVIVLINPAFNKFSEDIINKDFPEFYSSRVWMWEPSYRAALNGGITGLGYGISDPDIKPGSLGDHYEDGRFVREKGNSVLALVEETGLIGLVLFIMAIFVIVILSVTKDLTQRRFFSRLDGIRMTTNHSLLITKYSLLTASLAAFIIHAQFEAWWVGVGSVQLPLFFIYIGLISRNSKSAPRLDERINANL